MANICSFILQVQGTKESVEEFLKIIYGRYDYNTNTFTSSKHFWRVCVYGTGDVEKDNAFYKAVVYGDCAWSVASCMFEDGYYSEFKRSKNCRGTCLEKLTKQLHVAVDVVGEETGFAFQEHYVVVCGKVKKSEVLPFYDECIGNEDELADFNKRHGTSFTMDDVVCRCLNNRVFSEYVFVDHEKELINVYKKLRRSKRFNK